MPNIMKLITDLESVDGGIFDALDVMRIMKNWLTENEEFEWDGSEAAKVKLMYLCRDIPLYSKLLSLIEDKLRAESETLGRTIGELCKTKKE